MHKNTSVAIASADRVGALLENLRAKSPLIHCITNVVAANFTANVLLALGASPAMVDNTEEAGPFAGVAGAMLVNLGTFTPLTVAAMRLAVRSARQAERPWVLDPVGVGALAYRTGLARDLMMEGPAAIRGNASEIASLGGQNDHAGRGVDSTLSSADAIEAARRLAGKTGAVVGVTGQTDYVTDGTRLVAIANGDAIMARVTALGCALSAVVAAFLAVGDDAAEATASALLTVAVSGEIAADGARGPGQFATAFLDTLYTMTPADLSERAKLTI
ncbi:MAG: hydroxyethylthiazole kinase [Hyphomicrobiales bacterium]